MRLVAYCRVSTDKDEQLESLTNQQEFFEKFAARNNHDLIKIYSDEGISGKQMKNRKEFLQLLEDAKLGLFDMVVVKDISRFARNTVDFLIAIRELKALNIEVQFVSINQTILGNSEFVLTMFSAIAQEESANLSSRVKFGKRVNAKHGKVPNFIYGYDWIDRFTLKINEIQAKIVREIFHMYVEEGLGSRRIAKILTNRKVPSPKGCDRWIPKTVRRILMNPIYKGVLISKKSEGINFLTGERKIIDDVSEFTFIKPELAIVSEEIFDKAQEIMAERQKQYANENPNSRVSTQYPFSTLIKCEHCGYSFTRRIAKLKSGDVSRWKCAGRNVNDSNFCPNTTVVDEDELLDEIRSYLFNCIKDKDSFIRNYESANRIYVKHEGASIAELEKEIAKLKSKKVKYREMYLNELIDIAELKSSIDEIDKQLLTYEKQLLNSQKTIEKKCITAEEIYDYMKIVLHGNYSNIALKKVINMIYVNKDGEIKIEWK